MRGLALVLMLGLFSTPALSSEINLVCHMEGWIHGLTHVKITPEQESVVMTRTIPEYDLVSVYRFERQPTYNGDEMESFQETISNDQKNMIVHIKGKSSGDTYEFTFISSNGIDVVVHYEYLDETFNHVPCIRINGF